MKPFLLLAIRAEDAAADNEYVSFRTLAGLAEDELRRFRLEQGAIGGIDLRDWSGILLGGGPFNYTDPEDSKSPAQRRVEADLQRVLDQVVDADFPFLGACYGAGALGRHEGAVLGRRYGEPVGTVEVSLTPQGQCDPLLAGLPAAFDAFTGHKEAVSELPGHAVLLATSASCPVQMFRVGTNVYATQFHAELDVDGLTTRTDVYKHAGYFAPEQADEIKAEARRSNVIWPPVILRQFVQRYADRGPGAEPGSGRPPARAATSRLGRRPPRSFRGGRAALPTSPGHCRPCTGAWSLTSVSPRAASDPAVTRPAELSRRFPASRRSLGSGAHTTLHVAGSFQDL